MKKLRILPPREDQRGAVAIIVGVFLLLAGIGFAALAIDISHIHVVRNELQNAADAGALRGARVLLNSDGTTINTNANQAAYDAATANKSFKTEVELYNHLSNTADYWGNPDADIAVAEDVLRGHWSFTTGEFTPCEAPCDEQTDLFSGNLDTNTDFINAIWIRTRRHSNPASPSWFGKILGWFEYRQSAEAVAYRGFAGDFPPNAFDQPIAICRESIKSGEEIQCNIGRMLDSSNDPTKSDTGGWTNYTQDPCETANPPSVGPYICGDTEIPGTGGGLGLGATNGVVDNLFRNFRDCWLVGENATEWDEQGNPIPGSEVPIDQYGLVDGNISPGADGLPDRPWHLRLPVVACTEEPDDKISIGNCPILKGAVDLNVVWVIRDLSENPTEIPEVPDIMWLPNEALPDGGKWFQRGIDNNGDPIAGGETDEVAWNRFISAAWFNLKNQDGSPAPLQKKAMYFMPQCEEGPPVGGPGGEFFGVMSEIPKLVQ